MFDAKVKINLDTAEKIMLKRNLGKNGSAQKLFTHEVRRLSDPYVPFDTGALKNTAVEETTRITYVQPYSRRWWYTHKGAGMRGPRWCLRMWASQKGQIISTIAKHCGGKS